LCLKGEDTIASGDNGIVYILRKDKVVDTKFKAHNSAIPCIGTVDKSEQKNLLLTISNEGIMSFWDDNQDLVEQF
jgi:hypothetical protein